MGPEVKPGSVSWKEIAFFLVLSLWPHHSDFQANLQNIFDVATEKDKHVFLPCLEGRWKRKKEKERKQVRNRI